MSKVLLFAHPGGEHVPPARPARGEVTYLWNTNAAHRRKFLICRAEIAQVHRGLYAVSREARDVSLWGEWEPPSLAGRYTPSQEPMLPQAWHRPLPGEAALNDAPRSAQNTDPWIFGPVMRYSNCRQLRHPSLRELDPGDVVFFGSLKKRDQDGAPAERFGFFLDTVFVVGSAAGHPPHPTEEHDLLFRRAVLERLASNLRPRLTLYKGRMLHPQGEAGLFSWVPCRPLVSGDPEHGQFARPMINQVLGLVDVGSNPRLPYREVELAPDLAWKLVADRCTSLGLNMAIRIDPVADQSSHAERTAVA